MNKSNYLLPPTSVQKCEVSWRAYRLWAGLCSHSYATATLARKPPASHQLLHGTTVISNPQFSRQKKKSREQRQYLLQAPSAQRCEVFWHAHRFGAGLCLHQNAKATLAEGSGVTSIATQMKKNKLTKTHSAQRGLT